MQIRVSGYGIPGYETNRIILGQHSTFINQVYEGVIPRELKRIHFQPGGVILLGPQNVGVFCQIVLFTSPNYKMADITKPTSKAFRSATKLSISWNQWFKETPKQAMDLVRTRKVLEDTKLSPYLVLGDKSLPLLIECEAKVEHTKLEMRSGCGYTIEEYKPPATPAWDDDTLDEQINYYTEDEDIPF